MNKNLKFFLKKLSEPLILKGIGTILIVGLFIYAYARIFTLSTDIEKLTAELNITNAFLRQKTDILGKNISNLDQKAEGISATLTDTAKNFEKNVAAVKSEVGGVQQKVGEISGTVSNLEKLSETDQELLQKYSKVYFLNEHYAPKELKEIEKKHLYSERKPLFIHRLAYPHLINLLNSAEQAGQTLYVKSAYRSFNEQQSLKGSYTITYGSGANTFSADQGYSEHQLGTTVDFITTGLGGTVDGFDGTSEYKWLLENAHKFGFILSYPSNNSYYIFEPWHWRYVGIKLAADLKNQNKNFYDLPQRQIDKYLLDLLE